MRAGNPKLAGLDLDLILTPAATLRPGAAQRCIQRQACPAPPRPARVRRAGYCMAARRAQGLRLDAGPAPSGALALAGMPAWRLRAAVAMASKPGSARVHKT